ncbi:uncharacterized protein AKAME5_001634200 [Lates japonicus]|uniref:Uncharacterized protein n=1 Tax=Lates japonicus TaxID=270547 RepID=A0AAD3RC32_LATJO|nr:uncharacterized protein AKAME5_001634200 [Lates japonicus]
MCRETVEAISAFTLDVVEPQVLVWAHGDDGGETSCSHSVSRNRNYYRVTEEDIQASLGSSLHLCFGAVLGVEQGWSPDSDELVELMARDVMQRVNRSLNLFRGPDSFPNAEQPAVQPQRCESHTEEMVHCVTNILRACLRSRFDTGDRGNLHSDLSDDYSDDMSNIECFSEGDAFAEWVRLEVCCSDELMYFEDFSEDDDISQPVSFEDTDEGENDAIVDSVVSEDCCTDKEHEDISKNDVIVESVISEDCCTDEEPDDTCQDDAIAEPVPSLPQQDKTFLAVFLGKLVEHIAESTRTSICNVDFDGILTRMREKMVRESSSTLPQTVGEIHILIYRELCREFGSAMLLQAAMLSSDVAFEEAVLKFLKVQLQRNSEGLVKRMRRFFKKRSNRVSPACEGSNLSASKREDNNMENESTPPPVTSQRCPAIMRMFSSVARILKKPFTSCTNC